VANAQKNPAQSTAKDANLPFEESLKKLEGIVEAMESEELPLETLLAKYEEGTRLAKSCQDKLAEAELKIQQLEKTPSGELAVKPFATAFRELAARPVTDGTREGLASLRWMIEEFRVSLFAQDLKTVTRVSEKRLAEQLQQARVEAE